MAFTRIVLKSRRVGLTAARAAATPTATAPQLARDVFDAILLTFISADEQSGADSENYFTPAPVIEDRHPCA